MSAPRPKNPDKLIKRIRNRSERRIKRWREQLQTRIGKERKRRRERIEEIHAALDATAVSEAGLSFIAGHEGIVLRAYNDPAGHCTFGIGHLIHLGACTAADARNWANKTREFALRLLDRDCDSRERVLADLVRVDLNQHQFDALLSFLFNVGEGNFRSSTLLRLLNQGDYRSVPAQLMRWVDPGSPYEEGLRRRRHAEGALFAHGDYS